VNQLAGELAAARETKRVERNGGCSRYGCRNNVSTDPQGRVSLQSYGQKFTFCSAACAANLLLNDLHAVKAGILGEAPQPESEKSILVAHPDKAKRDTLAEEDWFSLRHEKEKVYFKSRYGKPPKG
jgi:hypothetical protein